MRLQEPEHDVGIHEPKLLVPERLGKGTDNAEAQLLVELDGGCIGAHDVVELHGQESGSAGLIEAVIDQRAANSLKSAGLIETAANPDHKRAQLMKPTEKGIALKREADAIADGIAGELCHAMDLEGVRDATRALRTVRKELEAHLRVLERKGN